MIAFQRSIVVLDCITLQQVVEIEVALRALVEATNVDLSIVAKYRFVFLSLHCYREGSRPSPPFYRLQLA